jgi:F420-dependent methylenetetrahydromethanopterin dehydrogenase
MAAFNSDAMKLLSICGFVGLLEKDSTKYRAGCSYKSKPELETLYIFAKPKKCIHNSSFSKLICENTGFCLLHIAEKGSQQENFLKNTLKLKIIYFVVNCGVRIYIGTVGDGTTSDVI